jgi:uncharacterized membrane protein YfcA
MFFVGIVIAAVANGAGIGGATFFSPLFVVVLGLEPNVAIGTALITEVFGFASGVTAHWRARAIDWRLWGRLTIVAVPAAVAGSLLGGSIDPTVLNVVLGVGLLAIGISFVRHYDHQAEDAAIARGEGVVRPWVERSVVTRDGEEFSYRLCRRREGMFAAGIGGGFVGLISTGLGEANSYALVKRCRVPTRVTVATSVAVVAITALVASAAHLFDFVREGTDVLDTVRSITLFTVPGVIIGGQLGPRALGRIPGHRLIRVLGWLFLFVALLTLVEALR